jgi:hypothetical protein
MVAGNWVRLFQRGRTAVLEKFLRQRCQDNPQAIDVRLVRTCPGAEGVDTPSGEVVYYCKKGTMSKHQW